MAIWAAGPPKAVAPSFKNNSATSLKLDDEALIIILIIPIIPIASAVFGFAFLTGGVTAQAIAKVGNAFFAVFLLGFGAIVAGVARPLRQVGLVTIGAGVQAVILLPVIHGEEMRPVILRGSPGGGGMANGTGLPRKHAPVIVGVGMAGGALAGRALVDILFVAFGAFHIHMRTIEREAAQGVVKGGVFPVAGVVAGFAQRAILPLVGVILRVARVAIFGRAGVALRVAGFTLHIHMLAFEREAAQAVVKFGGFPGFGAVTHATLDAKLAVVGIVLEMAGFAGPVGGLQLGDCPRPGVTLGTFDPQVGAR